MGQIKSINDILGMIQRRFWMITIICAMGVVMAFYSAITAKHEYRSAALIQIELPQVQNTPGAQNVDATHELQLIRHRVLARDRMIDLVKAYDLSPSETDQDIIETAAKLRDKVEIHLLYDQVEVWTPNLQPSGLMVEAHHGDPEVAAQLANDLVRSVMSENSSQRLRNAQEALKFFAQEEGRVTVDIERIELQIAEFKRMNAPLLVENLASLRKQIEDMRKQEVELSQRIVAIESLPGNQRSRRASELERLQEQSQAIGQSIAAIQNNLATAPAVERQLNVLDRERKRLQDQYSIITERYAEAELTAQVEQTQRSSRFQVLEEALVPQYPVSRSRKTILVLGSFAGLLFALGVSMLIEVLNPAIRRAEHLERDLGIAPVVSIPLVRA